MHVLLLSCSTGEGHNHCARAVRQSLEAMGHEVVELGRSHVQSR